MDSCYDYKSSDKMSTIVIICIIGLSHLYCHANGAFNEVPVTQDVTTGSEAVFRCQHSTADNIRWRVNGTLLGRNPPTDITPGTTRDEGGNLVDLLSIVARREYNTTIVVCVAEFDDGTPDETSEPPALLHIIEFLSSPLSVNVTVDNETVFHCEHPSADGYSWFINETTLISRSDLENTFRVSPNGRALSLTVTALLHYDSTRIECVAFFLNGQPSERTPPALLLVQGTLDAVTNLINVNTTIFWEPPFSLDLTNVEPDIVYCVDVYNITCGGRDLVSSDCSVTDTNYTSLSDGYLYEYIVTPRSNVEGAENGTASQPLMDELPAFSISQLYYFSSSDSLLQNNYHIELAYTPAIPIPSSYTVSLKALDGLGSLDHVEGTSTEKQSLKILLNVTGLESRRLWTCSILAFGCEEHSLLSKLLSTYDFLNISISSPSAGVVRVTGTFLEGSLSPGILVIVSGDSDVQYHISARGGSDNHEVTIPGLAGGEYSVSVFVMEENGLPFERAAMLPSHLSMKGAKSSQTSPTIEYSLQSTSTGVCIQCEFLDNDASECIAVVHRHHNLMNIKSSHKFTRSGDTASGCIEGINLEDYHVGVVDGRQFNSGMIGVVCPVQRCTTSPVLLHLLCMECKLFGLML